jgi:hypothetical protein
MASIFETINDDPAKGPKVEAEDTGQDLFIVVDGVRIAKRGRPETQEAMTWVSLVLGWTVNSQDDHRKIEILHDDTRVY